MSNNPRSDPREASRMFWASLPIRLIVLIFFLSGLYTVGLFAYYLLSLILGVFP